jgi:transposase
MTTDLQWFAFIDWASRKHQLCLIDAGGKIRGERTFEHSGNGLAELCDWLLAKSGAAPGAIAVALEVTFGPLVETLLERGFAVFHLNPKQLDRFRDRIALAGAKDDRRDARVGAHALLTDRAAFRQLAPADPFTIQLRAVTRLFHSLTAERTRLTNQLQEQLWRYYPQALALTDNLASAWFLALWQLAPTPAQAARLRPSTLARLFKQQGVRRLTAEAAQAILRQPARAGAPGATAAALLTCRSLIARLHLVNRELRDTARQRDALLRQRSAAPPDQPAPDTAAPLDDVAILRSAPGLGSGGIASLLSEAPDALARADYHALRALTGVAPVTRQSGKLRLVQRRLACNTRLRVAAYHWARVAVTADDSWRRRYAALRARGKSFGCALRIIADGLLRTICAMLKSRSLYDPNRHPTTAAAP